MIQYGTTTIISGRTDNLVNAFTIIMIIVLILHIVALIKSKKAGISLAGSILGIIGSALFAIIGSIMGVVSMVLFILASIFLFKQKKVA
ncbi:hypothetical protein GBZ86_03970 [Clostridium tarantellae]|uniref:DUF4064 domain-containing protein n=1 Tax=Clostridium tarantellae TaxID=39493 RepID=A0A6I1ML21_9CLOT|nr:hypothetical protein [Clostridium tarantellae]